MNQFVTKKQLSEHISLSSETFKRYRRKGVWTENLYWTRINSRTVLYNLPLILDWVANRNDPSAHLRAIEASRKALLSNNKKKL
ncbi:MAG: hypothetical protein WBA57_19655 [Elainellaceae cyanobacterium]